VKDGQKGKEKMKAVILAGGYATRLWPLTKHIPKALLPIAGKPIIDFILEQMTQIAEIDRIIVSTNASFENHFRYWLRGISQQMRSTIKIVVEPTRREEEKLGAIGAIGYLIEQRNLVNDDLLIIAGDNLFEFRLVDLVDFYKQHNKKPVVAFCDLKSEDRVRGKYGVGLLDKDGKVIDFQEKSPRPKSTLASTGCYLYPVLVVDFMQNYLKDKNNPDAPGYFVDWLCHKTDVYAFIFDEAWYDIGSFEVYDQVNEDYKDRVKI
jgi:glucose-1-phosphate thymidylyltransferase